MARSVQFLFLFNVYHVYYFLSYTRNPSSSPNFHSSSILHQSIPKFMREAVEDESHQLNLFSSPYEMLQ